MKKWSGSENESGETSKPPTKARTHTSTNPMANRNLGESFLHAFEGLSHVIWTQRQVRIQLTIVVLVLLLSYVMKLKTLPVLFVLSAIALVLIAELFNTAIEVVVNMVTETYHPLAKIAKDVAAAGVLIASMYAFLVGCTVFVIEPVRDNALLKASKSVILTEPNWAVIMLLGIALVTIMVPLFKVRVGHGTLMSGGAVSGHTAVAFLLFAAIVIQSNANLFISIPALVLAILVAQSRVEGKIHTLSEVLWGAIVALVVMALLMFLKQ